MQCAAGHQLSYSNLCTGVYNKGWICDCCDQSGSSGTHRWVCSACVFDVCDACTEVWANTETDVSSTVNVARASPLQSALADSNTPRELFWAQKPAGRDRSPGSRGRRESQQNPLREATVRRTTHTPPRNSGAARLDAFPSTPSTTQLTQQRVVTRVSFTDTEGDVSTLRTDNDARGKLAWFTNGRCHLLNTRRLEYRLVDGYESILAPENKQLVARLVTPSSGVARDTLLANIVVMAATAGVKLNGFPVSQQALHILRSRLAELDGQEASNQMALYMMAGIPLLQRPRVAQTGEGKRLLQQHLIQNSAFASNADSKSADLNSGHFSARDETLFRVFDNNDDGDGCIDSMEFLRVCHAAKNQLQLQQQVQSEEETQLTGAFGAMH